MSISSSSSEDSDYTHKCRKSKRQRKFGPELWKDIVEVKVDKLPHGIDGLAHYSIENIVDIKARRKALSSDGRRWSKDSSTSWAEYGEMRFANCRGSQICKNNECPYKTQYGVVNKMQFSKGNKCTACGVIAETVACPARRYILVKGEKLRVFHCGYHTCPVRTTLEKPVDSVRDILKKDPTLTPSEVQSALLVSSLRGGESWDKIEKQASQLVDRKWISNQKQAVRRELNPQGENFEGVVMFKHFCDPKDPFYVYKINDSRGNPDSPTFVFKTSKAKLLMANNMNKDGEHFLNKEYCFFDGKKKRCRNYTTLTASVYHPLLKKQIPLAVMETETEDSRCVTLFWRLFQEALGKATTSTCTFNPTGWSSDMAGANLVGIRDVFGSEALKRVKTCEFHFKQNRNKKARELDQESSQEFKDMCDALLVAQTADGYATAMSNLTKFANDKPDRKFLEAWLKWWDDRREFIFNAFTPPDGPKMNQAEVIHAGWAHRDRSNLSLLDAAHMDTRDSILLEAEVKEYKKGTSSGGTGPSFAHRNYRRGIDQATRYGREISELGENLDGESAHRPPEKRGKSGIGKTKKKDNRVSPASTPSWQSDPTADGNNQSHHGYTRPATVQPCIARQATPAQTATANAISNIHLGDYVPPPFPPNYSFHFPIVQNDPIMARPIFPRLPYVRPQLPSTSTSASPVWHSGLSPYHYELIILPTNVRRCYGCNCEFVDKYRQEPYNIIVKHVDRRIVKKDPVTQSYIYSVDYSNTYYHPISDHIRRKNPLFTGLVRLPSSLSASLNAFQKQVLENTNLNIQIVD